MEYNVRLPNISPEVSANIFSKLFFCWVLPFMKYAANHTLQIRDVYDTVERDSAVQVTEDLQRYWNNALKEARIKNKPPNLYKALFNAFGRKYLLYGTGLFFQSVSIRIFYPIVLAEYIIHYEEGTEALIGWYLGGVIIILAIINSLIFHHTFNGCSFIGMRTRVAISSLIQKKVSRLSQYSLNRTSPSQLVNSLTEDVRKIEAASPYIHYLYMTPIQFLCSTYVLFNTIGIASFAGLIFMVIISLPEDYIATLYKEIKSQLSMFSNARVKTMKEILQGIRVIKFYGWEIPFENLIEKTRSHELHVISKEIFLKCISMSSLMFTQSVAVFLTLTTQILLGKELKTDAVFAVLLIFYNLQQYICYYLPQAIRKYAAAKASISRIENFLTMEEKEEQLVVIRYTKVSKKSGSINIIDSSAKWGNQQVLQDINIKIKPGALCCIFGPIGSGKTSFLQLLLKELTPTSGRVDATGTISYASQIPWLFSSSIKSNILFGLPYNRHKYREIVRIFALEADFQGLPYGDKALVTDKRIAENESIKEKINLARMVYKEADIYIVDDCFGSIDPQTEKFIFSECFNKYLKNKTRLFVSNKLHYAKEADTIVLFENGTISRTLDREDITEMDFQFLTSKVTEDKTNSAETPNKEKVFSFCDYQQELAPKPDTSQGYCFTLAEFLKQCGNTMLVDFVIVLFVVTQLAANMSDVWMLQWIKHSPRNMSVSTNNTNFSEALNKTSPLRTVYHQLIHHVMYGSHNHTIMFGSAESFDREEQKIFGIHEKDLYVSLYAAFVAVCIILTVLRSLLFHTLCMNASRALHNKVLKKVMYSPMKFFEIYPSGRILQIFSKDMDVVNQIPPQNFAALQMFAAIYGTILLIIYASPAMVLPMLLILIMVYFLTSCFVSTIRGLQRLENIAQAPINSFLTNLFYGVFTIRSAEAEQLMDEVFEKLLDQHTSVWTAILMCREYFCFYMDLVIILFMGILTFFVILVKNDTLNSGYVGLAITQSIILSELLHVGIRENIKVLSKNSAVVKILQCTKLATENVNESTLRPKNWPYCGKIVFKNVHVKVNDGPCLKNLNACVKPCEKIAVVSKYPEEKWNIVNSLLRLVNVEGIILLDGIDISQISLNKLRSNITVINQDPVLFSSTIRFNLDPLDYANDEMLWKVLEEVGLKTSIQSLSQPIVEGGFNFSAGQKQLLCLARAMLRNSKVIIIENNEINIDPNTDNIIQKIIHEKLKNCTVITIANNLNTAIMENDKVMVIEDGKEVEYAHAFELLKNPDGYLSKLLKETGSGTEETLKKVAKENYEIKNIEIEFKFD